MPPLCEPYLELAHAPVFRQCRSPSLRRLKPKQTGMTAKNRARLRQFDDTRNLARLLHVPSDLLQEARTGKMSPRRSALLVEVGLAIELLLPIPLRTKKTWQVCMGTIAPAAVGIVLDVARHLGATPVQGWGLAFSLLGVVALLGPLCLSGGSSYV